jgi:hypothetical protein
MECKSCRLTARAGQAAGMALSNFRLPVTQQLGQFGQ